MFVYRRVTISWLQTSFFSKRFKPRNRLAGQPTWTPQSSNWTRIISVGSYPRVTSVPSKGSQQQQKHTAEMCFIVVGEKGADVVVVDVTCQKMFFVEWKSVYFDVFGANEVKKVVCLEFIWLRDWWLSHLRAKDDRINAENSKGSLWIRMFGAKHVHFSKRLFFPHSENVPPFSFLHKKSTPTRRS